MRLSAPLILYFVLLRYVQAAHCHVMSRIIDSSPASASICSSPPGTASRRSDNILVLVQIRCLVMCTILHLFAQTSGRRRLVVDERVHRPAPPHHILFSTEPRPPGHTKRERRIRDGERRAWLCG
jgi:hypothetical protein